MDETIRVRNTQDFPLNLGKYNDKRVYVAPKQEAELPLNWDVTQNHINAGALEVVEKSKPTPMKEKQHTDNLVVETKKEVKNERKVRAKRTG